VINIDLPLLSAANFVNLEVFERRLHLESVKAAKYRLDFELPFPVDENKGDVTALFMSDVANCE